jgi:hypothetical protein
MSRVVRLIWRDQDHVADLDLVSVCVSPRLDGDTAARREGEIEVVVAGSAEPVVLDEGLVVVAAHNADNAAVTQVAQLSIAGWVEAFVHHDLSINSLLSFGCDWRARVTG